MTIAGNPGVEDTMRRVRAPGKGADPGRVFESRPAFAIVGETPDPPSRFRHPVMVLHPSPLRAATLTMALGLAACGGSNGSPSSPADPAGEAAPVEVPARGTDATFDVATWNVEWFGEEGMGPENEALQLQRVREVVSGADLDLWGMQEVVGESAFASLVAGLPGYAGFLANDGAVEDGPAWYSDFGDREQKVGLVYKTSVMEVLGARIVLTDHDHAFAGRPPLEVRVRLTLGKAPVDAVVMVLHAKAGADAEDWDRRSAAAAALKTYLDAAWPDVPVWVIGDFNDDVDTSITAGRVTPYAPLLQSGSTWSFPTAAISQAGIPSTVGYPDVIDHHLVSDEVMARYQAGSAEAYRLDDIIPRFGDTTSDHYPVLARYRVN